MFKFFLSILGESVEKREPFYTVGGNVNWYRQYGEQYGNSFKNQKYRNHMIQQFHSWAHIQRKTWFKKIEAPLCS